MCWSVPVYIGNPSSDSRLLFGVFCLAGEGILPRGREYRVRAFCVCCLALEKGCSSVAEHPVNLGFI